MKRISLMAGLALLAGCSTVPRPQPRPQPQHVRTVAPAPLRTTGLERVVGRDARALVAQFGPAVQDVIEASARKLQFASPNCILDAYLYPPARGKEPLVTYVDARQPDGRPIDNAACVAALMRHK
ncbi:hypothetical protein [Aquisediminimonas profunda]|uniref:hypothetical protein n=1 Tax=Aquisediminimonas profunda TaxID=1550733 RepID=UPI001C62A872|nr:hypothetical protein [Aquisediminimonas profunda]